MRLNFTLWETRDQQSRSFYWCKHKNKGPTEGLETRHSAAPRGAPGPPPLADPQ